MVDDDNCTIDDDDDDEDTDMMDSFPPDSWSPPYSSSSSSANGPFTSTEPDDDFSGPDESPGVSPNAGYAKHNPTVGDGRSSCRATFLHTPPDQTNTKQAFVVSRYQVDGSNTRPLPNNGRQFQPRSDTDSTGGLYLPRQRPFSNCDPPSCSQRPECHHQEMRKPDRFDKAQQYTYTLSPMAFDGTVCSPRPSQLPLFIIELSYVKKPTATALLSLCLLALSLSLTLLFSTTHRL